MQASEHVDGDAERRAELRKESVTMALYVAICLLAALAAVSHERSHVDTLALVWGTTVGLAAAHWLAFRLSARLVAAGRFRRHDAEIAAAQLFGAAVVALLATVAIAIVPGSVEYDVVRIVIACFIALVAFEVARNAGASPVRSAIYAGLMLAVSIAVALLKNLLGGH